MQVVTPHGFLNRLPRLSPSASASASTLPPLPCLLPLRLRPSPSLFCPALSFASPQPPVYFTLCVALAGVKQLGVSHVEEVPERVGGAMSPMGQRIADWFMPWHARWGTPGEVRKGGAGVVVVGAGCRLWLVGEEQGRGGGGGAGRYAVVIVVVVVWGRQGRCSMLPWEPADRRITPAGCRGVCDAGTGNGGRDQRVCEEVGPCRGRPGLPAWRLLRCAASSRGVYAACLPAHSTAARTTMTLLISGAPNIL